MGLLFKDDGETLTLEGEIISDFLDGVDFQEVFADPEVRESGIVTFEELWLTEKDGVFEASKEGEEGATLYPVETLDPEALAKIIDVDDLLAMFEYHLENELGGDTLEEKARLAAALEFAGYEVDEAKGPFKKGEFRKIRNRSDKGKDRVTRMLLAMLHKSVIKRVPSGKGYKSGDYKKDPAGYADGTPAGVKKWQKYKKAHKGAIARTAKKAKMGQATADAAGGKTVKKKAKAKKGAAKKLAKKGAQKGKKGIAASVEGQPRPKRILEGASLAGSLCEHVTNGRAPDETKKDKAGDDA
jgi:hypothetical protein